MASQVLESYLVSLGFHTDQPSFQKFNAVLAQADATVDRHASGMVKTLLKAQVGILGAFTSISAAIVGMVDEVAKADQSYRLFGMTMLMNVDSARKLKMITGILGHSMEEIRWDPELHDWFDQLISDTNRWQMALGPDFEKKMVGIRDLTQQFNRLELATKFLGMSVVEKLADKLGLGDITGRLSNWIDSLSPEKISRFADTLSTYLLPILKDTWMLFKQVGQTTKLFADDFSMLIGLLSGDSAIMDGSTSSLEKMAKAMEHVVNWAFKMARAIGDAEEFIGSLLKGMALLVHGDFSGAADAFGGATKGLHGGGATVLGVGVGGAVGTAAAAPVGMAVIGALAPFLGPLAVPVGIAAGAATPVVGAALGGGAGYLMHKAGNLYDSITGSSGDTPGSGKQVSSGGASAIQSLADAIQTHEGYFPGSRSYRNNNPGNLKFAGQAGATEAAGGFAAFGSYAEGRAAEEKQIQRYADRGYSLEGMIAKWAPSNENNTAAYIASVAAATGFAPAASLKSMGAGAGTTINLGGVTVNGDHANPAVVKKAAQEGARAGMLEALNSQTQVDLIQTAGA